MKFRHFYNPEFDEMEHLDERGPAYGGRRKKKRHEPEKYIELTPQLIDEQYPTYGIDELVDVPEDREGDRSIDMKFYRADQ
jgi:hypothetical protein